ncbi:ferrochelatase [Veillonella sp.]|uniref:ferrochelatase n=1 Tax=Veillonella sp. TaxID=1926307 RepID=UPI0025DE7312|nr:ferrochelatase [Veillonella sp.]
MKERIGLLVMDYGTPTAEADLMPYYTSIRRGYAPTEAEVAVLKKRYEAIGGLSPLGAITEGQAELLAKQLNEHSDDISYELYIGHKHMPPFIEDAVSAMGEAGITKAVAIVMAPYFSLFATASYFERAKRRAARYQMEIREVAAWNEEPEFLAYWHQALATTLGETAELLNRTDTSNSSETTNLPETANTVEATNQAEVTNPAKVAVIFTAHSLPYHVIHMGDTYPEAVQATAKRIAQSVGLGTYEMAWQSAGVRGDWLTPDVATVTREVVDRDNVKAVVYVPIGFVCDHLEILYDNDIACRALCDELGVAYKRVPMPNTDALFVKAMAQAVRHLPLEDEVTE